MKNDLKREVQFTPGHDCIRFECLHGSERCVPGGGGSHGRSGLSVEFYVKGEKGVLQFVTFTGWEPEPFDASKDAKSRRERADGMFPMPSDLGYHSPVPLYEGQSKMETCQFFEGGCYYDGSTLNAEEPFRVLCNDGLRALWAYLEAVYRSQFEDGERPKPQAYKLARRKS